MKKFLIEIGIFTLILMALLKAIKYSVPYYWGNKLIVQKVDYLNSANDTSEIFFIGSSKTYRHINSKLFDDLTQSKSFNLGSPGMFALETEYIIDNFLKDKKSKIDIYVQGLVYNEIADENLHTIRSNYFLDSKRTLRGVNYWFKRNNYQQMYRHVSAFIENQLCIGQVFKILEFNFNKREPLSEEIAQQNGFYSSDQELLATSNPELIKRNKKYQEKIQLGKEGKKKKPKLKVKSIQPNRIGIENTNFNMWQISGSPITESKFYFDKSHYNKEGADKFTKALVNKIKKRKNK